MTIVRSAADFTKCIEKEDFKSIDEYMDDEGPRKTIELFIDSYDAKNHPIEKWFIYLTHFVNTNNLQVKQIQAALEYAAELAVKERRLNSDSALKLIEHISSLFVKNSYDLQQLYKHIANTEGDPALIEKAKMLIPLDKDIKNKIEINILSANLKSLKLNKLLANILNECPPEKIKIFQDANASFKNLLNIKVEIASITAFVKNCDSFSVKEQSYLFEFLFAEYQKKIKKISNKLNKLFKEDDPGLVALNKMLEDKNPLALVIIALMQDFIGEAGNLEYAHALLVCAEISARKEYLFNPTALQVKELQAYLETLRDNKSTTELRERFIIIDGHGIFVDFLMMPNGKMQIFVCDPVGINNGKIEYNTPDILQAIQEIFPKATLYFSANTRQKDWESCQLIALDDLAHSYTLEKYGVFEKRKITIFDYFAEQNNAPIKIADNDVTIIPVQLPLTLMRTMQSRDLINIIIPSRSKEKNLAVNKEGDTAMASAKDSFIELEEDSIAQNTRITQKSINMAHHILGYLTRTPIDTVIHSIQKHTEKGFEARQALQASTQTPPQGTSQGGMFSETEKKTGNSVITEPSKPTSHH